MLPWPIPIPALSPLARPPPRKISDGQSASPLSIFSSSSSSSSASSSVHENSYVHNASPDAELPFLRCDEQSRPAGLSSNMNKLDIPYEHEHEHEHEHDHEHPLSEWKERGPGSSKNEKEKEEDEDPLPDDHESLVQLWAETKSKTKAQTSTTRARLRLLQDRIKDVLLAQNEHDGDGEGEGQGEEEHLLSRFIIIGENKIHLVQKTKRPPLPHALVLYAEQKEWITEHEKEIVLSEIRALQKTMTVPVPGQYHIRVTKALSAGLRSRSRRRSQASGDRVPHRPRKPRRQLARDGEGEGEGEGEGLQHDDQE
jgi:hypothetical protein